jgi:hypothetical protein
MQEPALPDEVLSPVHLGDQLAPIRQYVATCLDRAKTPLELDELVLDATKPYPDGDGYVWLTHKGQGYPIAIHFDHYRRFRSFNNVRMLRVVCRHPDGNVYVVHVDHRFQVMGAVLAKVAPDVRQGIPLAPTGDLSA